MKAITLEEYNKLSPKTQGYVVYMQGAWNEVIPKKCPYPTKSKNAKQWHDGQFQGVLDAIDGEE